MRLLLITSFLLISLDCHSFIGCEGFLNSPVRVKMSFGYKYMGHEVKSYELMIKVANRLAWLFDHNPIPGHGDVPRFPREITVGEKAVDYMSYATADGRILVDSVKVRVSYDAINAAESGRPGYLEAAFAHELAHVMFKMIFGVPRSEHPFRKNIEELFADFIMELIHFERTRELNDRFPGPGGTLGRTFTAKATFPFEVYEYMPNPRKDWSSMDPHIHTNNARLRIGDVIKTMAERGESIDRMYVVVTRAISNFIQVLKWGAPPGSGITHTGIIGLNERFIVELDRVLAEEGVFQGPSQ